MIGDSSEHEAPTRREYVKYGGAVVGGGLLAGCAGQSDSAGTNTSEPADEPTTTDTPYTVTVEPLGEFTFEQIPERYAVNDLMAADIAHALGKSEMIAGPGDMGRWPTFFYEQLPGVSFDTDDALELFSESGYDQEVFYEADPDVNLIDPGMARNYMQFDEADVEELAENTGPFVTPFNVFVFADFQSEHPTTIYEVFEQMSRVFREEERYQAFATLHDDVIGEVQSRVPPEAERPRVALVNAGSDPVAGEFYPVPLETPGTGMKPYRDFGLRDALADSEAGGSIDYEVLLEADPDVIAVPWQIGVPDEQFTEQFVTPMRNDSTGRQLRAVENNRVIKGQHLAQGPVINLFQTEYVAKQYYPEEFGEWPSDGVVPEDERLFDRQRVADIINGEF